MNITKREVITVRLSTTQIAYLKKYAKDCSITFSAALREHLLIAFREIKGRDEREKILPELDFMKSELRDLRTCMKDLKLQYSESTNSEGSD